jgi:hypothetical protein
VDLNPIRAALTDTIEGSGFTSAQKRCHDVQAKLSVGGVQSSVDADIIDSDVGEVQDSNGRVVPLSDQARPEFPAADTGYNGGRHLAPVELRGGSSTTGPCVHKQGARCSNKGFLPISTAEYLSLLNWTARQTRAGK